MPFGNYRNGYIIFLFATTVLAGCSSEVDKCVNAEVSAWQARKSRIEADVKEGRVEYTKEGNLSEVEKINNAFKVINGSAVNRDIRTREEVEAESRIRCMRASAK